MDDDLRIFEAHGAAPLPAVDAENRVDYAGARIWYGTIGSGPSVVLLHGAMGNSTQWGHQVPSLLEAGYRVILIDNRGRGRSTMGTEPLTYELMAREVVAVLDALQIDRAAVVGWSDGAIIGLILAMAHPSRVTKVFAFAGNMDLTGVKPGDVASDPKVVRVFAQAAKEYAQLSPAPDEFRSMCRTVEAMMKAQPNYTAEDLARIHTPAAIVIGESDEFLEREHSEYLARSIPGAKLIVLPGVTHFAPLQRPALFNDAMLDFLNGAPLHGRVNENRAPSSPVALRPPSAPETPRP
jgi:pimeloyl-ACP methyl ester carboxylesterase